MSFADIHMHLLYGVDDGAENEEQMKKILDAAYSDGTRIICATPHFHPGYFGDNAEAAKEAFEKLKAYARKYPDLTICLGNELRYSLSCGEWLQSGACRTINGTQYVLVDFLEHDDADFIVEATLKVFNSGFTPILAHAERYEGFHKDMREIEYLRSCGVLIQVDSTSPFGGWGAGSKRRSRRIIEARLADLVASDAHNTSSRPPNMSECYKYILNKCGSEYAGRLCLSTPTDILNDIDMRKDMD